MTVSELPGWLALVSLGLFALASFCFAAAGVAALVRALRGPRLVVTEAEWDAFSRTCCLLWWATYGETHDEARCTRKDTSR